MTNQVGSQYYFFDWFFLCRGHFLLLESEFSELKIE